MAKKDDMTAQLQEREKRRRSSVVSNMISASPMQSSEPAEEIQETEADIKKVPDKATNESEQGWELKKIQTKSRRKTITLYPSVHDRALKKCKLTGITFNHAINELLEKWTDAE